MAEYNGQTFWLDQATFPELLSQLQKLERCQLLGSRSGVKTQLVKYLVHDTGAASYGRRQVIDQLFPPVLESGPHDLVKGLEIGHGRWLGRCERHDAGGDFWRRLEG